MDPKGDLGWSSSGPNQLDDKSTVRKKSACTIWARSYTYRNRDRVRSFRWLSLRPSPLLIPFPFAPSLPAYLKPMLQQQALPILPRFWRRSKQQERILWRTPTATLDTSAGESAQPSSELLSTYGQLRQRQETPR